MLFTQMPKVQPKHVGPVLMPLPAMEVCRKCSALKIVGYLCACERQVRACGADDPEDSEHDVGGEG